MGVPGLTSVSLASFPSTAIVAPFSISYVWSVALSFAPTVMVIEFLSASTNFTALRFRRRAPDLVLARSARSHLRRVGRRTSANRFEAERVEGMPSRGAPGPQFPHPPRTDCSDAVSCSVASR